MRWKSLFAAPLLIISATASADVFGCAHTAARRVAASLNGASRIVVVGRAGALRVKGRPGTEVVASGTACASDQSFLKEIELTAVRDGSDLKIEAVIPDRTGLFDWTESRLDFEVAVPDNVALVIRDGSGETEISNVGPVDVVDGSGSLTIRGVRGNARVNDGSGELVIENVSGDVEVQDGSGEIEIKTVGGSVLIDADGSGSIDIRNVQRNVTIENDGSGSIDVSDVRGDFVVEHDGSGAIDYERVGGRVRLPTRD